MNTEIQTKIQMYKFKNTQNVFSIIHTDFRGRAYATHTNPLQLTMFILNIFYFEIAVDGVNIFQFN